MAKSERNVHRFRFGDWVPSPIKSISADPFSSIVAIGREDGDIELSNSESKWHVQARVSGSNDFSLQCLKWSIHESEQGRLFGVSLRGFLFEVDVGLLSLKNVRDSYGGAAWCLGMNPRRPLLAIGCEDGSTRIFSYEDGQLEYFRSQAPINSRILSIAYHPSQPRLFLGCADGTIRCVEEDSGRSIFRMTGDFSGGVSSLIWSMLVLSDSTVVTGDSRGHVHIWDGVRGALVLTIHQHTADVLALAASPDETQVFASGVDSRVSCIQRVAANNQEEDGQPTFSSNDWVYSSSHRPHSHDVFALEVCRRSGGGGGSSSSGGGLNKSKGESSPFVLLSGGNDCKLCCYSVANFAKTRPSWILPVPAKGLVQASADHSKFAVKHQSRIDIWSVAPLELDDPTPITPVSEAVSSHATAKRTRRTRSMGQEIDNEEDENAVGAVPNPSLMKRAFSREVLSIVAPNLNDRCRLSVTMNLNGTDHIHCCALSPDGRLLVACRASCTRLWLLDSSLDDVHIKIVTVDLPEEVGRAFCQSATFSCDSCHLVLASSTGKLFVVNVSTLDLEPVYPEETEEDSDKLEADDSSDDGDDSEHVERKGRRKAKSSRAGKISQHEKKNDLAVVSHYRAGIHGIIDHAAQIVANKQAGASASSSSSSKLSGAEECLGKAVTSICFSSDCSYLAVADGDRKVYVYEMDRMKLHWLLPRSSSSHSVVVFHPTANLLLVVLSSNRILFFDVEGCKLSKWSEETFAKLPNDFVSIPGVIDGAVIQCSPKKLLTSSSANATPSKSKSNKNGKGKSGAAVISASSLAPESPSTEGVLAETTLLLHGQGFLVFADLSQPMPRCCRFVRPPSSARKLTKHSLAGVTTSTGSETEDSEAGRRKGPNGNKNSIKKRPHNDAWNVTESSFAVVELYRSMVYVGILDKSQVVVVENPWSRILEHLPSTLARKRYGT